jgi:hypothetical protein
MQMIFFITALEKWLTNLVQHTTLINSCQG